MSTIVYLFPDTNVLEQCRPLEQLDWSAWRQYGEVHLIISRPVQTEIDDHKNKGGERIARRARRASSLIREIILGQEGHSVIRPADPLVKLFVRPSIRPSQAFSEVLDYSRPGDQLVGTVQSFIEQHPGADARVLTHDTGPMGSAQTVGIAVAPVPDDWLLPPEPSDADKKIRNLEAEVARLKATEPNFRIMCVDADGNERERLEFNITRHEPLAAAEVSALMETLKQRFPLATDFGHRERAERPMTGMFRVMAVKEVFTPATDKEIEEYRKKYDEWLKECEAKLGNLHAALDHQDGQPEFVFVAVNEGTRPANDALITLQANGRFHIMPPPYRSEDGDEAEMQEEHAAPYALPSPPKPPRGSWRVVNTLDGLGQFSRDYGFGTARALPISESLLRGIHTPTSPDPNEFYYKPDRPSLPGRAFSLECAQWRHGVEPESFVGQIYFEDGAEQVSGALECRIHAENLSEMATKRIPVRLQITRVKVLAIAENLIDSLR
jgi:hypothetical protein